VKALWVAIAIGAALVLQTTLGPMLVRGSIGVDLGLVVVAFVGLMLGPSAGLVAGSVTGLAQDAIASDIVGVSGLSKTVVGFLVGVVGRQFIVARPVPRFVVFVAATLVDAAFFVGLHAIFDARLPTPQYAAIAARGIANAAIGVSALSLMEFWPRFVERRRAISGRGRTRV
jgi:rod shape-determining protein MreD